MLYKLLTLVLVLLLCACASVPNAPPVPKKIVFSEMYKENPTTILVPPPVNNSTAADAGLYFTASVAEPLGRQGYYVLPIPITNEILQKAGIHDGAQLKAVPMRRFRELFHCDAVLFVTIESWDKNYYVVGGDVTVGLSYRLVSTKTGNDLWRFKKAVVVNTGQQNNGGGGGLIGALIATAIVTAAQDYFPVAQQVNNRSFKYLPFGKYNRKYQQDNDLPSHQSLNGLRDGAEIPVSETSSESEEAAPTNAP